MADLSRAQIAELCGCKPSDIPREPRYNLTKFITPGPVGEAYLKATGPIDAITGPAGSGKTVCSIFKAIRFSVASMPVCNDGTIRVRGTVLRDNFRALYRTTLRSWFEFMPPDFGGAHFTGGQDRPAQHLIRLAGVRDGVEVPIDLTVDFFAIGDVAIEELLKGYETSWVWCNEGDLLHQRVIPFAYSRTGRYPPNEQLAPGAKKPRVVMVDFNPPDIDHPLWKACETGSFNTGADQVKTVNFFHQPSGLSKEAENRVGKSFEAYQEEANLLPEEEKRRFVDGLPGYALDGRPVYKAFDMRRHVAGGPLPFMDGLKLHMGFDQGLSPGVIFFQVMPTGQFRILAELIPDHGTGAKRFLEMILLLLNDRFRGARFGVFGSDPSGFYGADTESGELSWSNMISAGLRHLVQPAPSNEPSIRIESVNLLLTTWIDAETPAILVDPSCRVLIGGFAAHYKFRRIKSGSTDRFEDRPYKNNYATAHDSLQYGVLTVKGMFGVIGDVAKAGRPGVPSRAAPAIERAGDFSVWSV